MVVCLLSVRFLSRVPVRELYTLVVLDPKPLAGMARIHIHIPPVVSLVVAPDIHIGSAEERMLVQGGFAIHLLL